LLDTVSTARGSGWVIPSDSKSIEYLIPFTALHEKSVKLRGFER
jgi:hypothetical protein